MGDANLVRQHHVPEYIIQKLNHCSVSTTLQPGSLNMIKKGLIVSKMMKEEEEYD